MGLIFLLISAILLITSIVRLPGRKVFGAKKIAVIGCIVLLVIYYLFAGYLLSVGMFNLSYLEMIMPVLIGVLLLLMINTSRKKI